MYLSDYALDYFQEDYTLPLLGSSNISPALGSVTESITETLAGIPVTVGLGTVTRSVSAVATLTTLQSRPAPGTITISVVENITTISSKSEVSNVTSQNSGSVTLQTLQTRPATGTVDVNEAVTEVLTSVPIGAERGTVVVTNTGSVTLTSISSNAALGTPAESISYALSNVSTRSGFVQRTNLLTYSEQFDNAVWTKGPTVSVTANTTLAPDGTISADTVTADSGQLIYQNITSTIGTVYCQSVFIKAGTATAIMFRDDTGAGRHIVLNPSTGVITTTAGTLINSGSQSYGDGWWRYWFVYAADTTTVRGHIRPDSAGAGQTFIVWGAQTEIGSAPTSYIPTVATPVTRSIELVNVSIVESIAGIETGSGVGTPAESIIESIDSLLIPVTRGDVTRTNSGNPSLTTVVIGSVPGTVQKVNSGDVTLTSITSNSLVGTPTEAVGGAVTSLISRSEPGATTESLSESISSVDIRNDLGSLTVNEAVTETLDSLTTRVQLGTPIRENSGSVTLTSLSSNTSLDTPTDSVSYSLSTILSRAELGNVNESQVEDLTPLSSNPVLGILAENISYTLFSLPSSTGVGTLNEAPVESISSIGTNVDLGTLADSISYTLSSIAVGTELGTPTEGIAVTLEYGYAYDYFLEDYVSGGLFIDVIAGGLPLGRSLNSIAATLLPGDIPESISYTPLSTNSPVNLSQTTSSVSVSLSGVSTGCSAGQPSLSFAKDVSGVGVPTNTGTLSESIVNTLVGINIPVQFIQGDENIVETIGGITTGSSFGNITGSLQETIDSQSSTIVPGNITEAISASISGIASNNVTGIVSSSLSETIDGISIPSNISTPVEGISYSVQGIATNVSFIQGNENIVESISGISTTGTIGTVNSSVQESLDGQVVSLSPGAVSEAVRVDLNGRVILSTLDLLLQSVEVTLASQLINGSPADITPREDIVESISGISSRLETGNVTKEQSLTLLFQQIDSALGTLRSNVRNTLNGSNVSSDVGYVSVGGAFSPDNANLGVYEINEIINANIRYYNGVSFIPITLTLSPNATYSNSITNSVITGPSSLSNTVVIVSGTPLANITGYFDAPTFNQSYIDYVSINTNSVIRIDNKDYANIWAEFDTRVDDVLEIVTFKADAREYITFEIVATVAGDTKTYNITVLHPDYSIERDLLSNYVAVT